MKMQAMSHYTEETANKFKELGKSPSLATLIYRDIPDLIRKYNLSGYALDFGCGPGISTRFISNLGFNTMGVDINPHMLKAAICKPDGIPFALINHAKIPISNNYFDLVFSVMVLLEIPTLDLMQEAVNELYRVLKYKGVFLVVVGSENFHKYNWLNKNTLGIDNHVATGEQFITYSKTLDMNFKDFYYTDHEYQKVFKMAGFRLLETYRALGKNGDNMPWTVEKTINPFTHYVLLKD